MIAAGESFRNSAAPEYFAIVEKGQEAIIDGLRLAGIDNLKVRIMSKGTAWADVMTNYVDLMRVNTLGLNVSLEIRDAGQKRLVKVIESGEKVEIEAAASTDVVVQSDKDFLSDLESSLAY
jgi:hypothetical protein